MSERSSAAPTIITGGKLAFKVLGAVLFLYVAGAAIYAYTQFSATKTKLLTYGLSDATGHLLAYAVMLVALAFPLWAIARFFIGIPRWQDWLAAMALPMISWGTSQLPANFDSTTGEALKYCAQRTGGELFCLDRPGVDPLTQRPLKKLDAQLAERGERRKNNMVPKHITLPVSRIEFFDSLSDPSKPEPKVWTVEDGKGCYTLFDNPGVDPTTGEVLKPVTKQIVREVMKCAATTAAANATADAAPVQAGMPTDATSPKETGWGSAVLAATNGGPPVQTALPAQTSAEQERQRREAAADAQRQYQVDLVEASRVRDQELRKVDSDYRQAEISAQNVRASALSELQRSFQKEQARARTGCDLQDKVFAKLGAIGNTISQGSCQHAQADVEAKFRQGNIEVEASYQATLKTAQDAQAERIANIQERFERSRTGLPKTGSVLYGSKD